MSAAGLFGAGEGTVYLPELECTTPPCTLADYLKEGECSHGNDVGVFCPQASKCVLKTKLIANY